MMASTYGYGEQKNPQGILSSKAYTVISLHEAQGKKLMRIRNPLGRKEWSGDYSDNSPLWTESLKKELGWVDKDDGMLFMPF